MLAAFLVGQIENMEKVTRRRGEIFDGYVAILAPLVDRGLIQIPVVPQFCTTNYHMFYVLTAGTEERTALIAHLRAAGIFTVFDYMPLHSSPFAQSLGMPADAFARDGRTQRAVAKAANVFRPHRPGGRRGGQYRAGLLSDPSRPAMHRA